MLQDSCPCENTRSTLVCGSCSLSFGLLDPVVLQLHPAVVIFCLRWCHSSADSSLICIFCTPFANYIFSCTAHYSRTALVPETILPAALQVPTPVPTQSSTPRCLLMPKFLLVLFLSFRHHSALALASCWILPSCLQPHTFPAHTHFSVDIVDNKIRF